MTTTPPALPTQIEVMRTVMAAREDGDDRVSMAEVCRRLRLGHRSTAIRYVLRGARTAAGGHIQLPAVRLGRGHYYTTAAALEAFVMCLNALPAAAPAAVRSPAQRRRASEAAAKKLDAAGI